MIKPKNLFINLQLTAIVILLFGLKTTAQEYNISYELNKNLIINQPIEQLFLYNEKITVLGKQSFYKYKTDTSLNVRPFVKGLILSPNEAFCVNKDSAFYYNLNKLEITGFSLSDIDMGNTSLLSHNQKQIMLYDSISRKAALFNISENGLIKGNSFYAGSYPCSAISITPKGELLLAGRGGYFLRQTMSRNDTTIKQFKNYIYGQSIFVMQANKHLFIGSNIHEFEEINGINFKVEARLVANYYYSSKYKVVFSIFQHDDRYEKPYHLYCNWPPGSCNPGKAGMIFCCNEKEILVIEDQATKEMYFYVQTGDLYKLIMKAN